MSELGVFAVDRGVFDHPMLDDGEPFTKREAWLWLLAEASWKPRAYNISGTVVQLQRGQLAHSVRYMAAAWHWPKSNVARFLARLKSGTMIGTEDGTAATILTICKYDAYQRVSLPSGTANGTQVGTEVGQQRDRKEDIQGIQEVSALSEPAVSDPSKPSKPRAEYPADFDAAWLAYPRHKNMSKAEALPAWRKLSAADRALVLASIPGYVAFLKTKPDLETIHFCRYLSKRRFEGFAPVPVTEADWRKRMIYARARSTWSTTEWGPMPGNPGCIVPAEFLLATDGAGWREHSQAA